MWQGIFFCFFLLVQICYNSHGWPGGQLLQLWYNSSCRSSAGRYINGTNLVQFTRLARRPIVTTLVQLTRLDGTPIGTNLVQLTRLDGTPIGTNLVQLEMPQSVQHIRSSVKTEGPPNWYTNVTSVQHIRLSVSLSPQTRSVHECYICSAYTV